MVRQPFWARSLGSLLRGRISFGMNEITERFGWRFIAALAIVLAWAANAVAQTVVVGTDNPDIDVPAVQRAAGVGEPKVGGV
jgi:hypothetical protein